MSLLRHHYRTVFKYLVSNLKSSWHRFGVIGFEWTQLDLRLRELMLDRLADRMEFMIIQVSEVIFASGVTKRPVVCP